MHILYYIILKVSINMAKSNPIKKLFFIKPTTSNDVRLWYVSFKTVPLVKSTVQSALPFSQSFYTMDRQPQKRLRDLKKPLYLKHAL